MEYFANFPTVSYNNTVCLDISHRVGILGSLRRDPYAFAPYDLSDGERADRVADLYYGDASREWIVWLSAGIVDPYDQWMMSQGTLENLIETKYGSIELAQRLTHHYEFNWSASDVLLPTSAFAALPNDVIPFYEPKYDGSEYGNILGYSLRRDDIRYSTNLIMTLTVDNNVFDSGDFVTFGSNGSAEVCWSNASTVKIQHVENSQYLANSTIVQFSTGSSANVVTAYYTCNTIPLDIRSMFSRVSMYDYEVARNDDLKTVKLIDKRYTTEIEKELTSLLKV